MENLLFSDEATFNIRVHVNWHNCHYYSDVNPHWQRNQEFRKQWSINVGNCGRYYWSIFLWGESQRSKLFTLPSKWLTRLVKTGWQTSTPHNVVSTGQSTCTQSSNCQNLFKQEIPESMDWYRQRNPWISS